MSAVTNILVAKYKKQAKVKVEGYARLKAAVASLDHFVPDPFHSLVLKSLDAVINNDNPILVSGVICKIELDHLAQTVKEYSVETVFDNFKGPVFSLEKVKNPEYTPMQEPNKAFLMRYIEFLDGAFGRSKLITMDLTQQVVDEIFSRNVVAFWEDKGLHVILKTQTSDIDGIYHKVYFGGACNLEMVRVD